MLVALLTETDYRAASFFDQRLLTDRIGREWMAWDALPGLGTAPRPPLSSISAMSDRHEMEPVTRGERLVAITFIHSLIPDVEHRSLMYELNEVAAIDGGTMDLENFTRLQAVQHQLLRIWRR